ncbi:conserved hypothetical protein [mine drainage metagenome]|uniref:Uncharacterized protein n=1 Tax=mine drainage metagenome TaxID=410659 RepID=A0A3P3ZNT7_9ZZZZ
MTFTLLMQEFIMVAAKKSSSALQSPESEALLVLKKNKKKAAKKEKSKGSSDIGKEKKGKKAKKAENKSTKKLKKSEKKARKVKASKTLGEAFSVVTLVDAVVEESTPAEVTVPSKPSPSTRKKKSAGTLASAEKPRRPKETPALPEKEVALPAKRVRRVVAPVEVTTPPLAEGKTRRTSVKKTSSASPVAAQRRKRAVPSQPPIISLEKVTASSPKSPRRPRAPKTIPPLTEPPLTEPPLTEPPLTEPMT